MRGLAILLARLAAIWLAVIGIMMLSGFIANALGRSELHPVTFLSVLLAPLALGLYASVLAVLYYASRPAALASAAASYFGRPPRWLDLLMAVVTLWLAALAAWGLSQIVSNLGP